MAAKSSIRAPWWLRVQKWKWWWILIYIWFNRIWCWIQGIALLISSPWGTHCSHKKTQVFLIKVSRRQYHMMNVRWLFTHTSFLKHIFNVLSFNLSIVKKKSFNLIRWKILSLIALLVVQVSWLCDSSPYIPITPIGSPRYPNYYN